MPDTEVERKAGEIANSLKGVRCPNCGEEISELLYYAYELNHAHFYINENTDKAEYHNWDTLPDVKGDPEYVCPECHEVLFHSQEKAEAFLRGLSED